LPGAEVRRELEEPDAAVVLLRERQIHADDDATRSHPPDP